MEYRYTVCGGCHKTLRLSISDKDFGRTVVATCPTCGGTREMTLLRMDEIKKLMDLFIQSISDAINNSRESDEIAQKILKSGFAPMLGMMGVLVPLGDAEAAQNGAVEDKKVHFEWNKEFDRKFAEDFKIKLDE